MVVGPLGSLQSGKAASARRSRPSVDGEDLAQPLPKVLGFDERVDQPALV
jgi:hypothetical protein